MAWARIAFPPRFDLYLETSPRGLRRIWFDPAPGREGPPEPADPLIRETARQLDEYFSHRRRAFDLPLDLEGTRFQLDIWNALLRIPYGETRSYGQLAAALGYGGAARAVGTANGSNPISIVVPCHRVIGSGGRLCGYGGGMERKQYLLDLESGISGLEP